MRLTVLRVLVASLVIVGCSRSEASTLVINELSDPVSGSSGPGIGGVGTTGRAAPTPAAAATPVTDSTREVTLPAGTILTVTLDTPVGSDTSRIEQAVTAHLSRPIRVHGRTVLATGSRVSGVVTDATRSGKVKGRAHVAMRFNSLTPHGEVQRYAIRTAAVGRTAQGTKRKDAAEIGGPAAGGAIIGALVGGKKGALVGTAIGGGAGTAAVLSTRGKEVHLGKGAALTLRLTAPVTVRISG
jgi:hypothetical protein